MTESWMVFHMHFMCRCPHEGEDGGEPSSVSMWDTEMSMGSLSDLPRRLCLKPCANRFLLDLLQFHSHSCLGLDNLLQIAVLCLVFCHRLCVTCPLPGRNLQGHTRCPCWAGNTGIGYFFWVEWAPKIRTSFQIAFGMAECVCLLQRAR